jgi:hypothetical protein
MGVLSPLIGCVTRKIARGAAGNQWARKKPLWRPARSPSKRSVKLRPPALAPPSSSLTSAQALYISLLTPSSRRRRYAKDAVTAFVKAVAEQTGRVDISFCATSTHGPGGDQGAALPATTIPREDCNDHQPERRHDHHERWEANLTLTS